MKKLYLKKQIGICHEFNKRTIFLNTKVPSITKNMKYFKIHPKFNISSRKKIRPGGATGVGLFRLSSGNRPRAGWSQFY